MRSIFFILSDDNIGSTPRFAPGSQVQPSVITIDDEMETDSAPVTATQGSPASARSKRQAGDVFSGTSLEKRLHMSIS
jgi:hypothetical protein